ncbi:MAG: hypothetical protein ACI81Y_001536 [Glaciecola sp.]
MIYENPNLVFGKMNENYDILIKKLDGFIRKFYRNKVIRGLLYSVGLVVAFFMLFVLLEHLGRFSSIIRTGFFWSFTLLSIGIIIGYIIIPLVKMYRLGKVISYEQASDIIGDHFSNVKDKLLNTLQLKKEADISGQDSSLLHASIDQKIRELKPVPFDTAINLGENKKYLKYALPPLILLLAIFFVAPKLLRNSTERLVKYNNEFEIEAPFQFNVLNEKLNVPQHEDFLLNLEMTGEVIPEEVYLQVNGAKYKLNKENTIAFYHTFNNVQTDIQFSFIAEDFQSKVYELKALPKPIMTAFDIRLDYPGYTGLKDEILNNTGNLSIPTGTMVQWEFQTEHTDDLTMYVGDSVYSPNELQANIFQFKDRFYSSMRYAVANSNSYMKNKDSILYQINVTPDLYPEIQVEEQLDSISDRKRFFSGEIRDDYGFSKLSFNYVYTNSEIDSLNNQGVQRVDIPFKRSASQDRFFYYWNMDDLNITLGSEIEYYFQVWDNDGVRGAKSTKSQTLIFKAPSADELADNQDDSNEEIKDKLEDSIKKTQELEKDLDEMRKDLIEKKELSWQDKKKIESLIEKQKSLQQQVEDVQKENKNLNFQKEQYDTADESLMDKQKKLEELFDKVMNDEMKEMFKELEKMMEQMDQDKLREQLEKINLSNEDLENELDRNLEIFKQLEMEQKANEISEKIKDLAKKQEELAKKTEEKSKSAEELKKEQEELAKEFEKLQEDLDELDKLNEELEEKADLDTEDMEEQIKEDMQDSADALDEKKNKDAAKSQEDASKGMQSLAEQLDGMGGGAGPEMEDMDALRALLENIIQLSFDQEGVMSELKGIDNNDPKYVAHAKFQRKLKDDAQIVKDSLLALSKRVIQIEPIVNKEINQINGNMLQAIEQLSDRKTNVANEKQQYVMTSLNNLALLLDEALKQMQQEMASGMPGKGNCQKPGGFGKGKPSLASMKKMQEALSKKLSEMGKSGGMPMPGGKKEGGQGMGGMSKEVAQMAAEQAALRQAIEKMGQDLNEDGSGNGNDLKEIAKKMEENEKDLVNMKIQQQTLNRQQEILTRLLKSDKAQREREYDNKRKSEEANEYQKSNPDAFFEYKKEKEKELELLKTIPPSLKPYYKSKVSDYFIKFED